MEREEVLIDGSYGEGGGQVLRTSLSLSAITGRPVRIANVRAGRPKPGLQPQHLTAVRAVAMICGAEVEGDAEGSREVRFQPGPVQPGDYAFDVRMVRASAGSMTLVFQTVFLPLALAGGESRLYFGGGTHNPWAPPFPYLERVFLPTVAACGLHVTVQLRRAGWYPVGKGEFRAEISPCARIQPLDLVTRGPLSRLVCYSAASNLPEHVVQRQATRAQGRLKGIHGRVKVEQEDLPSPGIGSILFVQAEFEGGRAGFTGLGARGKPAERVADEACGEAAAFLATDAPVDPHLADQLALPLALAQGTSRYRASEVTGHLRTNLHVLSQFLPVRWEVQDSGLVTIEGAGSGRRGEGEKGRS